MKKIVKFISAVLAIVNFALCLSACGEKENGLYTWYGRKIEVDNVLRVTLDMGNGKRETLVPFELYRALFLYYAEKVPDFTTVNGELHETTDEERTDAAKSLTEEELTDYYAVLECARDAGVDVDDILGRDYAKIYKSFVTDADADKSYEEMLESLDMTHEYFVFNCCKSELEKALKSAVSSDIEDYTNRNFYHMKQIRITYDIGDGSSRSSAKNEIESVLSALESGEDFDVFVEKYADEDYKSERYIDTDGGIVGGGTLSQDISDILRTLDIGEHSGITEETVSDKKGAFVIIKRENIDISFLCGADDTAAHMYSYQNADASEYTPHYLAYATLLDAYKQNLAVAPVDEKIYSHIAADTLY